MKGHKYDLVQTKKEKKENKSLFLPQLKCTQVYLI